MHSSLVCRGAVALVAAVSVFGNEASAQAVSTPTDPAPSTESNEPTEFSGDAIVVTAQKRAENIQDVPISIAVLGGTQLETQGITRLSELGRAVPSLTQQRAAQAANVRLNIRGIGSLTSTGIEPAVATFLDDVYVPRPGSLIGRFFDVSSIEVLRGPQGTLFGRNASAGAINIKTKRPTDELEGSASVEASSWNSFEATGTFNAPLGDVAAFRLAAQTSRTSGFGSTTVGDHGIGKQRTYGLRGTLRLEPAAGLTWLLRADYMKITGDGAAFQAVKPDTVTPTAAANFAARLGGQLPDLYTPFDRTNNNYVAGFQRDRQYGVTSDLSYEFGSGFTLRLVNAYRDWQTRQVDGDILFTPLDLVTRNGFASSESQSHELQFISPSDVLLGGRLSFVGGLYYFKEVFAQGERLSYSRDFCDIVVQVAAPALYPACSTGSLDDVTTNRYNQKLESIAAYAQADFKLTDTLILTGGARYTRDKKDGLFDQTIGNAAGALFRRPENTALSLDEGRLTWRANLAYKPTNDLMFFASYTTGFKSGGINAGGGTTVLGPRRAFKPETVSNIEFGAKTAFARDRVILNVTAFRMDVSDLQENGFDGTSLTVTNAAKIRQQGIEMDASVSVIDGLKLNGAIAYLDSKFLSYPSASNRPGVAVAPNPGTAPGTQNLAGARGRFSPKWQGNVGAQYDQELGGAGYKLSLIGNLSFISDQNVGLITDDNPQSIQKAYQLVSARAVLHSPDDRWSVSIFGDNLFNKGYCTSIFAQTLDSVFGVRDGQGNTLMRCTVGNPRSIGARLDVNF